MRVTALILAVVAATLLGGLGRAEAEKVKTNQTTKVYAGPGEQRKVILKLEEGQSMTLLAQDGRWLKVRVRGRTGYVPRSKVDMADDGTIARNTRRRPFVDGRSRRRGFGGGAGPEDRIGADAIGEGMEDVDDDEADEAEEEDEDGGRRSRRVATRNARDDEEEDEGDDEEEQSSDDEEFADDEEFEDEEDTRPTARVTKKVAVLEFADPDSDEMFVARTEDVLYPTGRTDGDWTEVESEEGDIGWIRNEYLDTGSGGMRKRQIGAAARLGFMFIQQGMRTAGSQNLKVPDNYNIGTPSVTLSLGGSYKMPFKKKYILGAELTYDYSKTLFGGIFYDPDGKDMPMPGVNTGLAIHNVNVRAMAGYDLKKKSGMAVFGRLGYRYQSFLVSNYNDPVKNPARIPQEVMKGPTLGAAFVMPKLTDKIGLEVALDTILFGGKLTQTKGLEDGSKPTFKAVVLGAGVTYRWKHDMNLQAMYDLRYTGIDFGPPLASSMRGHMGTNVRRSDIFHMLTVGVVKPF